MTTVDTYIQRMRELADASVKDDDADLRQNLRDAGKYIEEIERLEGTA
jgi:hypothetical protein